jgi:polyisoprenoid-binding protein YceI
MLLRMLFFSAFVIFSTYTYAQQLTPTDQNSNVSFQIVNHLLGSSTVNGHFTGLRGTITFDPKAPEKSTFDATISVKSIKTGISMRDNDLQAEKYFNSAKYPTIHIKSVKVSGNGKSYVMTAQLTIKDVTKTISIPFTATPASSGYIFKGQFTINRMDYHVGPDNAIDKQLTISLSVFAKGK